MTKPFMQTGISILLRKDISEEAGLFDFLTPFSPETWVGILVAYIATAACIFLVTRFVRQLVILENLVSYGGLQQQLQDACHIINNSYLCTCRLSPCEWSQPLSERNGFSFLHSLWYTAGALTLQGETHKDVITVHHHLFEDTIFFVAELLLCWQVLVRIPELCQDASSAALGGYLPSSFWLVISPISAPLRPLTPLSSPWKGLMT